MQLMLLLCSVKPFINSIAGISTEEREAEHSAEF
jgi:hypothetical protein